MPEYESTETVTVDAPPRRCFETLVDYERMPSWLSSLSRCEVLDRDEEGRGLEVLYEVDAKLRTVSYRLRHDYPEPSRISSFYAGGDFRDMEGDYRLREQGGGARVRFSLRIDPGFRIPRRVVSMLNERVMRQTLRDLKRHVEAGRPGSDGADAGAAARFTGHPAG